jgi:hypothetical protein
MRVNELPTRVNELPTLGQKKDGKRAPSVFFDL